MRRDDAQHRLAAWFRDLCREGGLRVTPQRLEILQAIVGCSSPPTAEDVYRALLRRMPTLSLDTVYRSLALFEHHGILAKLWGPDGRCHFDPNQEPHLHLICRKCGRIQDFTWSEFEALKRPASVGEWGRVSRVQVEMHGLCARCLERKEGRTRSGGRADAVRSLRAGSRT